MFDISKLLNISEITKRTDNFFKLSVQLFYSISYPELALIALRANRIAARAWEAHEGAEAHDAARRAKLFAGVAVCLGIMIWATVIRLL